VEGWIRDINRSEDVAIMLLAFLQAFDPSAKKATGYARGQMSYWPALP